MWMKRKRMATAVDLVPKDSSGMLTVQGYHDHFIEKLMVET